MFDEIIINYHHISAKPTKREPSLLAVNSLGKPRSDENNYAQVKVHNNTAILIAIFKPKLA